MPRTTGTRNRMGGKGYSKPKYGQRVNPEAAEPGFEGVWDLFQLLLDPGSTLFGAGGGETSVPKSPAPPTSMSVPDTEMAVEGAHQTTDMAQQVAQWDPFKGMVPMIGGGEAPPMPAQRPPMPSRGMMPPTQPAMAAAPPMPARPQVNDREMALAQAGIGQFGVGPYAQPMGNTEADQMAQFFSMLARGM